ncbi:hypothetical protein OQA88_8695 [Cercophora sp. LCS_1]
MAEPRRRLRDGFANGLHKTAIALILIPFLVNVFLLLPGTFQTANSNGAQEIALSSFSMVSVSTPLPRPEPRLTSQFNGIIPSNTTNAFLVTLQHFPNAFTWSWPDAPSPNLTSGILHRGPSTSFDPFTLIETLPALFELPPDEYQCLESHYWPPDKAMACTNPFWTAVLHNRFLMCPLPKGTKDEIEGMSEHEWDRIRLWCYGLAAAYAVLPAVHESFMAGMFVLSLRRFDDYLPKEMSVEPEIGRGFLLVAWGGAVASVVAFFCVLARSGLTRPRGWMEQQGLEPLLVDDDADN